MKPMNENIKNRPGLGRVLTLIWLGIFCLVSLAQTGAVPAHAQTARKQVLFINSYHPGYKFSDDLLKSVSEKFQADGNIDLRVEYLDTKRVNDEFYLRQVYLLYQYKYKDAKLDLIMSSDDAALNFLLKYGDSLFPNIPVVFAGANFFEPARLAEKKLITGISEEADIQGTLDTALSIQPEAKNVIVITDTTVTGQRIREMANTLIPKYPLLNIELLDDITMSDLRQKLAGLTSDTIVILTVFSRDKAGTFYEYDQYSTLIAASSAVPVYATWDFSLGYGVVGGKLTSGKTEGERAAAMALRVLKGESPSQIPVDKKFQTQLIFDYTALEKWGIPVSKLPAGSLVLNRPISFYEANQVLVWGVLAGFVALVAIIVILLFSNRQRRRAQLELSESNRALQEIRVSLEAQVEARTRALTTSAEVSRRLSTIIDQNQLVREVVDQLVSAFHYYHAQIYFFDAERENLVMVGGTGEAGATLLAQKHQIARGRGLVGRAAETNQPVLAADVKNTIGWLPNPLLPETLSEAAIPIATGTEVLGVLDVQHNRVNGLQEEDLSLLQSLAGQVAISWQNARSFEQSKAQAELETTANLIGQKIQRASSLDEVLQIAARELGTAIGAIRVSANISRPSDSGKLDSSSNPLGE